MANEQPPEQIADEAARTNPPEAFAETLPGRPMADSGYVPNIPNELRDHSRYRVIRLIGRGGIGAVYQARTGSFGKSVKIRVQMWWNRNCIVIVRSPVSVDPEPLLIDYLHWLARDKTAPTKAE